MSRILLTDTAKKDLESLDPPVRDRILEKLEIYRNEPRKFARRLSNPQIGTYRFRIGDYRVIFDLDDEDIVVLRIGHRKEIYE